jgi:hypothetical protein
MTIVACVPGFDVYQMKYWKNTAHNLVPMEKENNSNINLCFYLFIVAFVMISSWALMSLQRIMGNYINVEDCPPTSQVQATIILVSLVVEN